MLGEVPCGVCKVGDFLPTKCLRCQKFFCKNHFQPDQHSCTAPQTKKILPKKKISDVDLCCAPGCKKTAYILRCDKCQRPICPEHRFRHGHGCNPLK